MARWSCLVAVLLVAGSFSASAATVTLTLTETLPGNNPIVFGPGPNMVNSHPVLWSFAGLPDWALVTSLNSVEFRLLLGAVNPAGTHSFAYVFADANDVLFGPETPAVTPPSHLQVHSTLANAAVVSSILADGTFQTILQRDPGPGEPGSSTNGFLYWASAVVIDANISDSAIPEPTTIALLGAGLGALALGKRRMA